MNSLLIDERPLTLLPSLVKRVGLERAVVLQQVHFATNQPRSGVVLEDGHRYVWNSYEEWARDHFPFWSPNAVKKHFLKLEEEGLLISCKPNAKQGDHKKYYRVNRPQVVDSIDSASGAQSIVPPGPDPIKDTETSKTETSEDSVPNGTGGKPAGPFTASATKPLGPFPDLSTTTPSTDPPTQTPQPPDLVSNPYAPAVAYFAAFGYAEKGTRSMIGAAVRDYGKEAVADILADVISRPDVAEPKAYFQKALQEHRLKNPVLPTLAEAAREAARYLTVRSLPNGNPIAAV